MTFPDVIPADILKVAKDIASKHAVDTSALEQEIAHALWQERQHSGLGSSGALGIFRRCADDQRKEVEMFMRRIDELARRAKRQRDAKKGVN